MSENQLAPIVPLKYSGQWIAWDFEETKIIASGNSYRETKRAAQAAGEDRPILVKAPDAEVRFLGGHS